MGQRREDFAPTLWTPRPETDVKQVWFSGVHSDIDGSYGPDKKTRTAVSDIALGWMLDEAENAGLKIESHIRADLTDGTTASLHQSRRHIYRFSKPLIRKLAVEGKPTKIHASVKQRFIKDTDYRPENLMELLGSEGWDSIDVEPA